MTDWLLHAVTWWVPWWAWALAGILAAAAVYRLLGWQGALAVVAALAGVLGYQRTRQAGYRDRVDDETEGLAKQQEQWDEIDRKPSTLDGAIDRMRHHNKDRG